ncbi:hypothetical protein CYMTET_28517, partial [Cymbomonas tetramitiformis]
MYRYDRHRASVPEDERRVRISNEKRITRSAFETALTGVYFLISRDATHWAESWIRLIPHSPNGPYLKLLLPPAVTLGAGKSSAPSVVRLRDVLKCQISEEDILPTKLQSTTMLYAGEEVGMRRPDWIQKHSGSCIYLETSNDIACKKLYMVAPSAEMAEAWVADVRPMLACMSVHTSSPAMARRHPGTSGRDRSLSPRAREGVFGDKSPRTRERELRARQAASPTNAAPRRSTYSKIRSRSPNRQSTSLSPPSRPSSSRQTDRSPLPRVATLKSPRYAPNTAHVQDSLHKTSSSYYSKTAAAGGSRSTKARTSKRSIRPASARPARGGRSSTPQREPYDGDGGMDAHWMISLRGSVADAASRKSGRGTEQHEHIGRSTPAALEAEWGYDGHRISRRRDNDRHRFVRTPEVSVGDHPGNARGLASHRSSRPGSARALSASFRRDSSDSDDSDSNSDEDRRMPGSMRGVGSRTLRGISPEMRESLSPPARSSAGTSSAGWRQRAAEEAVHRSQQSPAGVSLELSMAAVSTTEKGNDGYQAMQYHQAWKDSQLENQRLKREVERLEGRWASMEQQAGLLDTVAAQSQ